MLFPFLNQVINVVFESCVILIKWTSVFADLIRLLIHQATSTQQIHEDIQRYGNDPHQRPIIKAYHRLNPLLPSKIALDSNEESAIVELLQAACISSP